MDLYGLKNNPFENRTAEHGLMLEIAWIIDQPGHPLHHKRCGIVELRVSDSVEPPTSKEMQQIAFAAKMEFGRTRIRRRKRSNPQVKPTGGEGADLANLSNSEDGTHLGDTR